MMSISRSAKYNIRCYQSRCNVLMVLSSVHYFHLSLVSECGHLRVYRCVTARVWLSKNPSSHSCRSWFSWSGDFLERGKKRLCKSCQQFNSKGYNYSRWFPLWIKVLRRLSVYWRFLQLEERRIERQHPLWTQRRILWCEITKSIEDCVI